MAVPKRRTTRAKSKMRRAQHDKVTAPNIAPCSNCGEPTVSHRVCAACGFYKGAKVVETGKSSLAVRVRSSSGPRRRPPRGPSRGDKTKIRGLLPEREAALARSAYDARVGDAGEGR